MPPVVRRGLILPFVKPTRQRSLIRGALWALGIEVGGIVIGWTLLRWMGWV